MVVVRGWTMDRRAFLAGMAAAPLQADGATRIRPGAHTVEGRRHLAILAQGVAILKAGEEWERQAAIHADMSHRHHGCWRFLPWHRAQLLWFEAIVSRAAGQPFNLPYWDWTALRPPPNEVFDLPALQHSRQVRRGRRVPDAYAERAFRGRFFDSVSVFLGHAPQPDPDEDVSGSAEQYGHNAIHGFVGGDMGYVESAPRDALFWLHHCNVDRIWAAWEGHRVRPYEAAWAGERIGGFVGPDGEAAPEVLAGSLVRTADVFAPYRYDALPAQDQFFFRRETGRATIASATGVVSHDDGDLVRIDLAPALAALPQTIPSAEVSIQATLVVRPQAVPGGLTTFVVTGSDRRTVRGAVFPSEHHSSSLQHHDVSALLPLADRQDEAIITLTSEDVFDRGGPPLRFPEVSVKVEVQRLSSLPRDFSVGEDPDVRFEGDDRWRRPPATRR